ncbi:MAG: FHA domain-containing protein, partial [Planctomycetes bacterium]|nr:FHA domain-containing protein [Planctomycetota bacterium]
AIVGRHTDADLRFAFAEVSRRHCSLVFDNGQWRIFDLNSLNGVFVNNMLRTEATLYAGDLVRIGCVRLLIESATPVRMAKADDDKLRQIAEVLPSDDM